MNDDQFNEFLSACCDALEQKQAIINAHYALAEQHRWRLDQDQQQLVFLNANGEITLRFLITPIGTYSARAESWKWAWANPFIAADLQKKSAALKTLYEKTDFELFIDADDFPADAGMAWELAAAAVQHLGAAGCYRAPNQDTYLFLALEKIAP